MRILTVCAAALLLQSPASSGPQPGWVSSFTVDKSTLRSSGTNPYFVLEPGHSSTLSHGKRQLIISVTSRTKRVDGVETRVVEEIETDGGRPVESSRNYFAIDPKTLDVYYFGEDVDIYSKGRVVSHEGAWLSGVNGARFGLAMPGAPRVGQAYYQEIAPGLAMDRAKILSLTDSIRTPSRRFTNVLRVEETTQLEPGKEYKRYARGFGIIQDGDLEIVTGKFPIPGRR